MPPKDLVKSIQAYARFLDQDLEWSLSAVTTSTADFLSFAPNGRALSSLCVRVFYALSAWKPEKYALRSLPPPIPPGLRALKPPRSLGSPFPDPTA